MVMARRLRWLGLSLVGVLLIGARPAAPKSYALRIEQYEYKPETLTVALGDTVVWENRDIVTHTVTSDNAPWDSGDLDTKKHYRLIASERGRTAYHCEIHPAMHAVLIVR
jgi:plastocyanin